MFTKHCKTKLHSALFIAAHKTAHVKYCSQNGNIGRKEKVVNRNGHCTNTCR